MRIDLVGTTADFRVFGLCPSLQSNHLLCENRRTAGRIGEDGLGVVHSVGPAWHSRAGGRIDRRITLDITVTPREEGGPVLDAGGGLLGISTLGPRGRVLVIPASTVEAVLEPLISKGRVERGWHGLALQPVLVPEALQTKAGQSRGLMIMRVAKDSPAARANLHAGDILVAIADESVTSPAMLARHLEPDSVGKPLELRLVRADKPLSIQVTGKRSVRGVCR